MLFVAFFILFCRPGTRGQPDRSKKLLKGRMYLGKKHNLWGWTVGFGSRIGDNDVGSVAWLQRCVLLGLGID